MAKNDIIATRRHKILGVRLAQITNNLLARAGGRPYIDFRLHRAPNESDRSWVGSVTDCIVGRRDRAYLINDAGRIAQKINDHLFSEDAKRDGVNDDWVNDITATGLSIRQFWQQVSAVFSAGQWVWLQADRGAPEVDPDTGQKKMRSIARKEAVGDRVYWNIWNATEVVDWRFDSNGNLLWLLTQEATYDNTDPYSEVKEDTIRTLWNPGCWKRFTLKDGKASEIANGTISAAVVPFICLGIPSTDPWWFDDVEMIQAALMNLESLNFENLVQTVFPQLVVPASVPENIEARLVERKMKDGQVAELVRELIRGLEYPFTETPDDNGITRYLIPSNAELKTIPENQDRLRRYLFDMVGLAMFTRESRQVQSADAKQWDHLDVEATLKNRALLLQDAEKKMVDLSMKLDTGFKSYDAIWPQSFSIPNTTEDVDALTKLGNFIDLPPSIEKEIRKVVLHLLNEIRHIEPARYQELLADIDVYEPPEPLPVIENPANNDIENPANNDFE